MVRSGAAAGLHKGYRERLAGALEARALGSVSINVRITAVRKLAVGAADNGLLAPELAAAVARVKGAKSKGVRVGNWLSLRQAQALLNAPDTTTKKGLRDRPMLAILLGCGLRRSEVAAQRAADCPQNRPRAHRPVQNHQAQLGTVNVQLPAPPLDHPVGALVSCDLQPDFSANGSILVMGPFRLEWNLWTSCGGFALST
jgi:hypothetical protein